MERHPIESIMMSTMESIRDMVDVNTVIGDPIHTSDGSTVIPLSRVSFGFVAGGGEYDSGAKKQGEKSASETSPFAGGTGAGVSVQPVGFLVVSNSQVRVLPANYSAPVDRVIELAPQLVSEIRRWIHGTDEPSAPPPS